MRVLAPVIVLLTRSLAFACVCSDPCLEAARGDYVECRQGASETFEFEKQVCRDRDPACVEACAERREVCSDATGIGAALETCVGQQRATVADCVNRLPRGSKKREQCIENARIDGFQCRKRARSGSAPALRACRADFRACADGCGPGEPPRGSRLCRLDARRARATAVAACNQTATADKSACRNKDAACAESCRDTRTQCDAPARSALAAAIVACEAERRAAVAACRATNPAGSPLLDQCLESADTDAFLCRDAATKAQAPAFAACAKQYVGCVRACPPA